MHLYFLTRGRGKYVKRFIEDLEDVFVPYEIFNPKTKKKQKAQVQVVPRPVQLWECVFPEDQKDTILKKIGTDQYKGKRYSSRRKLMDFLAKALKLKPIKEKYKPDGSLWLHNVGLHLIGTKKDRFREDGTEAL